MKIVQTLKKKSNSRSKERKISGPKSFERKYDTTNKIVKNEQKNDSSPYISRLQT